MVGVGFTGLEFEMENYGILWAGPIRVMCIRMEIQSKRVRDQSAWLSVIVCCDLVHKEHCSQCMVLSVT